MTPAELYIAGVASYVAPVVSTAEAVENGWYDADRLGDGWTGAAVAGSLPPVEMALRASRSALERSGCAADEIDVLFYADTAPQGPHGWWPQHYVERHAVGRGVPSFELRLGCPGVLGGIELTAAYLAVPGRRAALVTGADNFGFDPAFGADPRMRWQYAQAGGSGRGLRGSILGDAASAAVLSRARGFARVLAIASSSLSDLEEIYRGAEPLFPPSYTAERPVRLGARFADHERAHPGSVGQALARLKDERTRLAEAVLAEAGVRPDQVTRALHVFAGTERYVEQVLQPLGIDPARGVLELGRRAGHLGTSDTLVGLEHLVETGQVGPGDHVLMMSNGGPSLSCAVLAIVERPRWLA